MTRASGKRERREVTEPDTTTDAPQTVTHGLYNQHDGLHGRDPNVMYLDVSERVHHAEAAAALGFDVDPSDNYKNYITTGTPLVTKSNLGDNLVSNPSTALLNARNETIVVDPVVEAEFVVEADQGSPFAGGLKDREDGAPVGAEGGEVPVDDGSATTHGTGEDKATTTATTFGSASNSPTSFSV